MNRSFVLGSISMIAGLMLLVMKMLARLVPGDPTRFDYTLTSLLGPDRFSWIDSMSGGALRSAASWLADAPLFLLCFGVGVLFILVSGLRKD